MSNQATLDFSLVVTLKLLTGVVLWWSLPSILGRKRMHARRNMHNSREQHGDGAAAVDGVAEPRGKWAVADDVRKKNIYIKSEFSSRERLL